MNTGIWSPSSTIKKVRATVGEAGAQASRVPAGQKDLSGHCCSSGAGGRSAPRELECSGSWIDRHDNWILGFT